MNLKIEETENKPIGKGISYDHTIISDKHYFAGFLNLAENNINAVFESFRQRFGVNDRHNRSLIENEFADSIAPSEYKRKMDFLKKHFPVVHYLDLDPNDKRLDRKSKKKHKERERRKLFRDKFKLLILIIRELRNFYSHYYHSPIDFDESLFTLLDDLFLSVIDDVRSNKMKSDQTRQLLKQSLREELNNLIRQKTDFNKERKKRGEKANLDADAIENGVLNDAFYHLLYKKEVHAHYKSGISTPAETENKIFISQSGLLFLLGFFLTRKESESLRSRVKGFKGKVILDEEKEICRSNNSLKYMATHWVFNYCAYRPVKQRLGTKFSKETLLIQIADELSKVPHELYEVLSAEQKEKFVEDMNEYFKDPDKPGDDDSLVIHPVIRKRYGSKFNYFAIRFLDEFANFPTLKFQVHLGNYQHDRRNKIISGTSYYTDRVIKEKINVFGTLSKMTELKADFFRNLSTDENTKWEIFPNPSYNFVGNNIPIFINLYCHKEEGIPLFRALMQLKKKQEKVGRKAGKPVKQELVHKINDNIHTGEPTALLSMNEVLPLLYAIVVHGKSGKEAEEIMVKKLVERYQAIQKYDPQNPLKCQLEVPKKLRKSSSKRKLNLSKLLQDVRKEIDFSDEKLTALKTKQDELKKRSSARKYLFTNKELGQEATLLAQDIKRFMPLEVRKSWKGYQHSHLQQLLAFYDIKSQEAVRFLEEFWDFEDRTYPFSKALKESFEKRRFEEFYRTYFRNRKRHFKFVLQKIHEYKGSREALKDFIDGQHLWSVFYKRLYMINETDLQKEQLLLKPLVFSRGIFDEKPTYIKGKYLEKNPELFADWFRYIKSGDHRLQDFYFYERDYSQLYDVFDLPESYKENKYQLSVEEKLELFKSKYDKKINSIAGQDLFLKLIAEYIFSCIFDRKLETSLADFYLSQEERIRKEQAAIQQSDRKEGDASENIVKDTFIWSKTFPFAEEQLYEPAVKLKDFGKFYRFLNDEKVMRIFNYDTSRIWSKQELEDELDSYENIRRETIFKLIHEFEKEILNHWGFDGENHPKELEKDGDPHFQTYVLAGVIKKYDLAPEEDLKWLRHGRFEKKTTIKELKQKSKMIQYLYILIYLRNKFAHNQLPTKEYFEIIGKEACGSGSYSEILCQYMERAIEYILSLVPNSGKAL